MSRNREALMAWARMSRRRYGFLPDGPMHTASDGRAHRLGAVRICREGSSRYCQYFATYEMQADC